METLVTGATAAFVTLFDLDRTFYVPSKLQRKAVLYAWWSSFIIINGLLAVLLFYMVGTLEVFNGMPPLVKAVVIGIGYLGLIRLKFATFSFQGTEVPFGLEAFYDAGKGFVFRRINDIAIAARIVETTELANNHTLDVLAQQAKLSIASDSLLTPVEKNQRTAWLLKILQDAGILAEDKKITLANYIKSKQMMS